MADVSRKNHCKFDGKMLLKNRMPSCELVEIWPVLLSPASPVTDRLEMRDANRYVLGLGEGLSKGAAARCSLLRASIVMR